MPKAELLGTFLEILSYGLYLILQIECLRVLWVKHRSGKPMHYLVGTSVAIFSLVTILTGSSNLHMGNMVLERSQTRK
ncbi:hypothetical protein PHLCEN_2v8340 [Hermanssonia centrifuga]|uniref:Uncharacterized protein n=1 Tax=Hermanssonia centrifuga TaxID=98765 RepID=A0A2R6NTY4_9APHY|nr:hypothetical protein PHLCEN_2v8340 [Hermanssonia centrifuga]